jgi:hypothetical protein
VDSVLIVTDRRVDLGELRRAIPSSYDVESGANDRIAIESNGRRAYLGADPRTAMEMEPEELSSIVRLIADPVFYVLDFSDIRLCKELLGSIANRADILVDNDHGVLLPGSEFVRLLQSRPEDWDWRHDHGDTGRP